MTKSLSQLADELKFSLDRFSQTRQNILDGSLLFARVCPNCNKLISNRNDLYALAELGECLQCDHVRSDFVYDNRY